MFYFPQSFTSDPSDFFSFQPQPRVPINNNNNNGRYSFQDYDSYRRSQEIDRLMREQQRRYEMERARAEEEEMRKRWVAEMKRREEEEERKRWYLELKKKEEEEEKRRWYAEFMKRREEEEAEKRRWLEEKKKEEEMEMKKKQFYDEMMKKREEGIFRKVDQEKKRIEAEEQKERERETQSQTIATPEDFFRLLGWVPQSQYQHQQQSRASPPPACPRHCQSTSPVPREITRPQPQPQPQSQPQVQPVSIPVLPSSSLSQTQSQPEATDPVVRRSPSPTPPPIPSIIPTATSRHLSKIAAKITSLASTTLPPLSTLHLTSEHLGFHHDNVQYLALKEHLEKILLELDGIDSEGKEEIRKERKRLVRRAEEVLEELEEAVKAEWAQRNGTTVVVEENQSAAEATVEVPTIEVDNEMVIDSKEPLDVAVEVSMSEPPSEDPLQALSEQTAHESVAESVAEAEAERMLVDAPEDTAQPEQQVESGLASEATVEVLEVQNEAVQDKEDVIKQDQVIADAPVVVVKTPVVKVIPIEFVESTPRSDSATLQETISPSSNNVEVQEDSSDIEDLITDNKMSAGVVIEPIESGEKLKEQQSVSVEADVAFSDVGSDIEVEEASQKSDGDFVVVA